MTSGIESQEWAAVFAVNFKFFSGLQISELMLFICAIETK